VGWEIGEDEDIYLAASTVLKTTVVHFAELPRGTADAVTREKEGRRGENRGKGERESEKENKIKKRVAGKEGNEMEPVASRKLKQKA